MFKRFNGKQQELANHFKAIALSGHTAETYESAQARLIEAKTELRKYKGLKGQDVTRKTAELLTAIASMEAFLGIR